MESYLVMQDSKKKRSPGAASLEAKMIQGYRKLVAR
jgi:hypothetical protein